ncbi:serine/threonine-protein kinase [Actinomadura kijaniata]|uniref:serine/threonine-protein kinase n=1 Tax=Actinomadura kijaniata TaxID=46161 RepID=UPI00082C6DF3|nr:serine/threonine-protein kinase [Actinomadura kijaniata]
MRRAEWRLPGYVELKELGAGGQGQVVLARHEGSGQHVAIKYLSPALMGDPRTLDAFRNEAALLERVSNPHVARLLGYFTTSAGAAIVMEAVPGRSLRRVLDDRGAPLAPEASLSILKGSLLGLAAAHAVGIVHRDYKPGNVLVQDDGQSKLIDFGIAVLSGQGGVVGTPAYMAPEQWTGHPATPATDVYAATCVFVECVTGQKPYQSITLEGLREQHTTAPVPLDRIPEQLRLLVARGMAKDPGERLWDANDFVAKLEAIAVRTYGPEWERRGLVALGAIAAALGTAAPAVMLGASVLTPGSSAVGSGAASAGQGVAALEGGKAGAVAGKGVLAKVGGAKGATGIAGAGTAAVVAIALLLPSSPEVGGEARSSVRASFTQPGALLGQPNMPASETPYIHLDIAVTPARVRAGTKVQMTIRFQARTLQGVKYLPGGSRQCFGEKHNRPDANGGYNYYIGGARSPSGSKDQGQAAFYPAPKESTAIPPSDKNLVVTTTRKVTGEAQPYNREVCGFLSRWTDYRTFTVPSSRSLRPGRYLLSPYHPPRFTLVERDGKAISPESVGATLQGTLPTVTVLE